VIETVATALRLPYVAITLQEETPRLVAAHGAPVAELLRLPLVYRGETVGQLLLAPRLGTGGFSPADRRLLDDLARQAGGVAHAVRLHGALQRSRQQLVSAQEEERRRLRRDLHDDLGPTLASLFQRLDTAQALVRQEPETAVALLGDLKGQVKVTIADIRRLVYALRPPALDEFGLVGAIREHVAQHQRADGLHVALLAPEVLPPLPAAVEVAAFRIVLEAVTNVVRHAQARICRVQLSVDGALCLEVADDGAGLPAAYTAGVGVRSMRERAAEVGGDCVIEPGPDGGTRVRARLPLPEE
jgi:signal transduction histidine kinase